MGHQETDPERCNSRGSTRSWDFGMIHEWSAPEDPTESVKSHKQLVGSTALGIMEVKDELGSDGREPSLNLIQREIPNLK